MTEVVIASAMMLVILLAIGAAMRVAQMSLVRGRQHMRASRLARTIQTQLQSMNFFDIVACDSAREGYGLRATGAGGLHAADYPFTNYPSSRTLLNIQQQVREAGFHHFDLRVSYIRRDRSAVRAAGVTSNVIPFTDTVVTVAPPASLAAYTTGDGIDDYDINVRYRDFNGDGDYYDTFFRVSTNTLQAVVPAGVPIHDVPPGSSFSIDRAFYQINSTTFSIGTSVWWEFRDNFGTGEYRSRWDANADHAFTAADPAAGPWTAIPVGGGIFFVDQAKTYVSGTVRGRITIVCTSPNTDPLTEINRGVIEVIGPRFGYTVGDLANASQSIFALSSRGYIFTQTQPGPIDLVVDGAFYAEAPSFTTPCGAGYGVWARRVPAAGGNAADRFVFNGSWNRMGLCEDLPVSNLAPVFNFDPNLQIFPSPGVPEKAVLASWRRVGS
ncbi:MAG: hypothetical protein IPN65_06100 [Elusimicrobia bacterium]|nr:hypothetical protein [Elusimicrobiota bacterium]MBK7208499.1 hypothetical protein [Elusimicrobiota bacterium]MBK7545260.1 hypothetical protein [Elusimicrobiota bacterium]MBK7575726.1 hypothetical protein [Elusimicrobiota bacterium]MBK8127201.1 hypothetical protein [Elusimicrobiota bacterium]